MPNAEPSVTSAAFRRKKLLETAFAMPLVFRRVTYFATSSRCEWCGNDISSGTTAHVVDWAHLHPACFAVAERRCSVSTMEARLLISPVAIQLDRMLSEKDETIRVLQDTLAQKTEDCDRHKARADRAEAELKKLRAKFEDAETVPAPGDAAVFVRVAQVGDHVVRRSSGETIKIEAIGDDWFQGSSRAHPAITVHNPMRSAWDFPDDGGRVTWPWEAGAANDTTESSAAE